MIRNTSSLMFSPSSQLLAELSTRTLLRGSCRKFRSLRPGASMASRLPSSTSTARIKCDGMLVELGKPSKKETSSNFLARLNYGEGKIHYHGLRTLIVLFWGFFLWKMPCWDPSQPTYCRIFIFCFDGSSLRIIF